MIQRIQISDKRDLGNLCEVCQFTYVRTISKLFKSITLRGLAPQPPGPLRRPCNGLDLGCYPVDQSRRPLENVMHLYIDTSRDYYVPHGTGPTNPLVRLQGDRLPDLGCRILGPRHDSHLHRLGENLISFLALLSENKLQTFQWVCSSPLSLQF